jgi:adenine phosphoribosyltransferase
MADKDLEKCIRDVPDFPKKGIVFKDITTLFKDKKAFKKAVDELVKKYKGKDIDIVLGIEARGFCLAPIVAYKLGAGFVPVRKPGKLPAETVKATYELEYGTDSIEIHKDAIEPGQRVLIVDDLLATGGTASAAVELVKKLGGKIVGVAFVIELESLRGRDKLPHQEVFSLIKCKY